MQPGTRRLTPRQLLLDESSRPVVDFFECTVTVHTNAQVIIRHMVHRESQARAKRGLDLNISSRVTDRIMVLRQPFVQRQLVSQACNHFTDITD
ncbi:hypothetical protein D3C76_1228680 [compost metagenome]